MPRGASKGFTVWTATNTKWMCKLLEFLLEKEFVTASEIFESQNKWGISTSSRHRGDWGMRPSIYQIWNFLVHKCSWLIESDKVLVTANKKMSLNKKILWELAPDWPEKFIEYQVFMMDRADMLREKAGAKWK